MRLVLILAAALGLAAVLTTSTYAQEKKRQDRPKTAKKAQRLDASFFERLDTNKDGVITVDEIPPERLEQAKRFIERLDSNKDGKVTREEFNAAIARIRPNGDRPAEPKPGSRPEGAAPVGERRPEEPARPGDPRPQGAPPGPGGPGQPPFGLGGPDLFRALDTNNDGKLSRDELAKASEVLMKFDRNGDGYLSPEELAEGIRGSRTGGGPVPAPGAPDQPRPEVVAGMFKRIDKNGDGNLSKDELPEMMRERFEQMDTNHDGFVDEKEFAQAMARIRSMRGGDSPSGARGRPRPPGEGPPGAPARPGAEAAIAANRERIANFLREHDKDGDGRISLKEFGEDRADEFKKLDSSGDGFLTPDELARGLP